MNIRRLASMVLAASSMIVFAPGCQPEGIYDPAQDPDKAGKVEVIPKDKFSEVEYKGFTFKIRTYLEETPDAKKAMEHAKKDADTIIGMVPEPVLKVMQKNPVWFELDILPDGAAWYHTSVEYLRENGYMVEKVKCVEIGNYVNYVKWSDQNQPYMMFHELCHLYHDNVYGFNHQMFIDAYNNAVRTGLYKNVKYFDGSRTTNVAKAYALNDVTEYFAELSEAYWGRNDYFPFDYDDLKGYDRKGFELMEKVWGKK